jgi:hypothetical protein
MSAELLAHAPPIVQVCYWFGLGAALALMTTVYKWVWRALGYLWNQIFKPPSVRELPMLWRAPEPPTGPHPGVGHGVGEVIEGGRPARKPR